MNIWKYIDILYFIRQKIKSDLKMVEVEKLIYRYDFFDNGIYTNNEYDLLMKHGLKSIALYYLDKNRTLMERCGKIVYEMYKSMDVLTIYKDLPKDMSILSIQGDLGKENGLYVDSSGRIICNWDLLWKQIVVNYEEGSVERSIWERIRMDASVPIELYPARYYHSGTHKSADIQKLVTIGLDGYIDEIKQEMKDADFEKKSFLMGLLYTAEGISEYFEKCAQSYIETGNIRLADAMKNLAHNPCRNFYEGIVIFRLLLILCNSEPNRIDKVLNPLYEKDLKEGKITRKEAKELLDMTCRFINEAGQIIHMTIGGCLEDGTPCYNELTEIILCNIGKYAHPHISIRINKYMPQKLWDIIIDKLGKGYANPALINDDVFINGFVKWYGVSEEDARNYAFGGCTETLICGMTNVDSTWVAFNTVDVINECLYRHFSTCNDFDTFYNKIKEEFDLTIKEMTEHINLRQHTYLALLPDPIISLFTTGCIQNGKSFWAGGAKYNYDSVNLYGVTNAIDSLVTIKNLFDGNLHVTKEEFLKALKSNFTDHKELLHKVKNLPKFGNGDIEPQKLGKDILDYIFDCIANKKCLRGNGMFMPALIPWITYVSLGKQTMATPDGRLLGEPLSDSCGGTSKTAKSGPTGVLVDAASLPQDKAIGTAVMNLKLNPDCFQDENKRTKIKNLFQGYLSMCGTQIQVTVIDHEMLQQAFDCPEEHEDLIVRVGGFSDYFVNLSRELQKSVVDRMLHTF